MRKRVSTKTTQNQQAHLTGRDTPPGQFKHYARRPFGLIGGSNRAALVAVRRLRSSLRSGTPPLVSAIRNSGRSRCACLRRQEVRAQAGQACDRASACHSIDGLDRIVSRSADASILDAMCDVIASPHLRRQGHGHIKKMGRANDVAFCADDRACDMFGAIPNDAQSSPDYPTDVWHIDRNGTVNWKISNRCRLRPRRRLRPLAPVTHVAEVQI